MRANRRTAVTPLAILALTVSGIFPVSLVAQAQNENPSTDEAKAQTGIGASEPIKLQEFVVTADKTARPVREVPMAVVAIDSKVMQDFKLFNVQDVQALSPGLDVKTVDPRNPIPSMRGITFNPDSGTSAAVDVYWNEVAVSAATGFRAMYDVGQIEVLKGPQGTLRGRSSPGGAITIASRKPDLEKYGFDIEQSLGSLGLANTQSALNLPLVKDKLALRIAGLYDANDANSVKNVVTNKDSRSHTRSIRASLEWKPTDSFELTAVYQYMHQVLENYPGVFGSPVYSATLPKNVSPFDRLSVSPGDALYDDRPVTASLTAVWKLPGKNELTAIAGWQDIKTHLNVEYKNLADIIPGYTYPQTLDIAGKSHSYELRFSSDRHAQWNYIFGAYYETSPSDARVQQSAVSMWFDNANPYVSASPVPRKPDYEVALDMLIKGESTYHGIFTTQTIQLAPKWRLEAGLRYQEVKANSLESDAALGINAPTLMQEKPVTGSASLTYQHAKDLNWYFTFGRSFRAGGQAPRTDPAELEKYLHYKSETSNGFEFGFKSALLNSTVLFNADVFYQQFKNYISFSGYVYADPYFIHQATNTYGITFNGDAETKGVEVGFTASLPHRVVFSLDASYADAKWTNALSPVNLTNSSGVPIFNTPGEQVSYSRIDGQPLGDTPKLTLTSHLEWTRQVGANEAFVRTLLSYKGSRQLVGVLGNPEVGGSATLQLFTGLRSSNNQWSATLWAKNILDREILLSRSAPTTIGNWPAGYAGVTVAPPRQVGVTVAFNF